MSIAGPNNPANGTSEAFELDLGGETIWNSPLNIDAPDDAYANCSINSVFTPNYSQYLRASDFAFSIPLNATINGIVANIERSTDVSGTGLDYRVRLVLADGVTLSTEDKASATNYPNVDTIATYGTSTSLWGETWTPADINDPNFGLALSVQATIFLPSFYVDHMQLTVYYTEASNNGTQRMMLGVG